MRINFLPVIFIIALWSINELSGQVYTINQSTGEPIENVAVYSLNHSSSTFSDANGFVSLSVFSSKDTLIFQHPSFNLLTIPFGNIKDEKTILLVKKNVLIEEFIISASKRPEKISNLPYHIEVISSEDIRFSTAATSAELLEKSGDVLVQKSQGGGGSPILRGFEANKVLLVVDGIRLNNAIYRNGHLQNSITIDNEVLEKAEVVFGPTSVIYGSDALGGVISYNTISPEYSQTEKPVSGISARYQYNTINNGETKHLHLNFGLKKIAILGSVTDKQFDDIRMGKNRNPFLQDYGKQFSYVKTIDGIDTIVENTDPLLQRNTGYNQRDYLLKLSMRPHIFHNFTFNVQYSTSSNIPRYESLNDTNQAGIYEFAEWYYGPQDRYLGALHYKYLKPNILFTELSTTFSHQFINEERVSREYKDPFKVFQKEHVDVYSVNMDLYKKTPNDFRVYYGILYTHNIVSSSAFQQHINTLNTLPYQTRYPDGDSKTNNFEIYGNLKKDLNENLFLSFGLRYGYYNLDMNFTDQFINLPFDQIKNSGNSLTGSLSLVYYIHSNFDINLIASSGFRNPNIDDLGKIRIRTDNILIPNNEVNPEYAYNIEFGSDYTIESLAKIGGNIYGTLVRNIIVRSDYEFNGNDSILFEGKMYDVQTNLNSDKAVIYGLNIYMKSEFSRLFQIKSTLNYTRGRDLSGDVPLGHIPPVFGMSSVKSEIKNFTGEFYAYYNGWKYADDFSPEDEDKPDEATLYGYPAWGTLNARISYSIKNYGLIQFSVENLLDTYYKPYASAVSGPGRSFIITLQVDI